MEDARIILVPFWAEQQSNPLRFANAETLYQSACRDVTLPLLSLPLTWQYPRMVTVKNGRGIVMVTNQYDPANGI